MKKLLALLLIPLFLSGCHSLDKSGVYKGDKFLYDADLAVSSGYIVIHGFVSYEFNNRSSVSPDVTKFADTLRVQAPAWFGRYYSVRAAYLGDPSAPNKTAISKILASIREGVNQAMQYNLQLSK